MPRDPDIYEENLGWFNKLPLEKQEEIRRKERERRAKMAAEGLEPMSPLDFDPDDPGDY